MRVHHLNCISTCPLGGYLMDGRTPSALRRGRLTCHCLLVETPKGLVLVDTGFGLRDVLQPRSRLSRLFLLQLAPELREQMTAIRQVERLGFQPRDVTDVVLTHLDFDHAGGLDDFPWARVHMLALERTHAEAQATLLDRLRYRPRQWSARSQWLAYPAGDGEVWYGFNQVRPLDGVAPEVVMIPLVGHTHGHAGVAVRIDDGWLLHAGDAYFFHREMDPRRPWCTPGLRLYQRLMEKDRAMRLWNQDRLRALVRDHGEVRVFCAHDVTEFERLAGRPAHIPALAAAAAQASIRPEPRDPRRRPTPSDRRRAGPAADGFRRPSEGRP